MNIRFTVSKVSPNDHLKLSQSRNVRATLELFAGHKSTSQIAPGICKIFSIPAPYGTISVIVGLAAFPRTNYLWAKVRITAQTGSSKRSNLTKGIGEKKERNWKSRSCQERRDERKAEEQEFLLATIMSGSIAIVTSLVIIVLYGLTMLATVKVRNYGARWLVDAR